MTQKILSIFLLITVFMTGCMMPPGVGGGGAVNGGYNTTNAVNAVPCGPSGSLVPMDPERFDHSMVAEVLSCQQWFRLAIYNQCLERNKAMQSKYLSVQIGTQITERLFASDTRRRSTTVREPRYARCQEPRILVPQQRRR